MARTKIPKGFAKVFGTLHRTLYRATGGRFAGAAAAAPIRLLSTTGRHSGKERTVPLIMLSEGDGYVAVASFSGHDVHPAWYLNLAAEPAATVTDGRRRVAVRAREAEGDERAALWDRMAAVYPDYREYQAVTERRIPVMVLEPQD